MANEQRPNSGILFKNNNKKEEKHPDFTGKCNVDGVEKEISLWIKTGQKGEYYTVSFKEVYVKP